MTILSKISLKNLKLNKKRTISTIIGIILSVALICGVGNLVTSAQKTIITGSINKSGYYHLKLNDIAQSDEAELKNNRNIKDIKIIYQNGYAILKNSQNEDKPYIGIYSMSQDVFNDLKFNLKSGRFPINSDEIVINEQIINNAKVQYKIGDTISLELGTREGTDGQLDKNFEDTYYPDTENLVVNTKKEYKIVGIMGRPSTDFEAYWNPGYTAITTNDNTGKEIAYVILKNPHDYKKALPNILGVEDYKTIITAYTQETRYGTSYKINSDLLKWEAMAFSDDTISSLYSIAGVIIGVILIASVFCIRNSFAIATTEKIKMYGMLSSVGATKKQIKKNVLNEALMLGAIGIPLGVLSGIVAIFILIKVVNAILTKSVLAYVDGICFNVSIVSVLISVILGICVIYLSAISSAIKASKVSPIENLRGSREIKLKNNKMKAPKIIKKVFKTGGVLAYKNLKRSRKKYRTTVISMVISAFLFITMSSFISYGLESTSNYYTDYDYNVVLNSGMSPIDQGDLNKIISIEGVTDVFKLYLDSTEDFKIFDTSKINLQDELELSEDYEYDEEKNEYVDTGKGKYIAPMVYALDAKSFERFCKKIGADYNNIKDKAILCDYQSAYIEKDGEYKKIRRYNYNTGDEMVGYINGVETKVKIGAVSEEKPYGIENSYYSFGTLVLNVDEYPNLKFEIEKICVNAKDADQFESQVKDIDSGINCYNLDEQAKSEKAMILIVNIFLYGFISVITLIGVTNIFNTITSNMELRQKEFAMLKSIGMTKKEFDRMINLETIFYCTKALIYGIILGIMGSYTMYNMFKTFNATFKLPISSILICSIFVFLLVFIIMRYSINKINKQNVIETIRNENV